MKIDVSDKNFMDVGLACVIEHKLEHYFEALGEDLPASNLYTHILREVEKPLIQSVLKYTGGNKVKAACLLGINRNTLYKKMQALELS